MITEDGQIITIKHVIEWAEEVKSAVGSEDLKHKIHPKESAIAHAILNVDEKYDALEAEQQARIDEARAQAEAEAKAKYESKRER